MATTFPLRTDRLLIEPMTAADARGFAGYRSDPAVARLQSWDAPYPLAAAEAALATNPVGWPVVGEWTQLAIREDAALLGDVAVHLLDDAVQPDTVEVGITLAREAQGRGIAEEALGAVVAACFDRGAHRVLASCDARNGPVARLLERLGFRHEARFVEAEHWKGEWTTVDVWARLAADPPVGVSAKGVVRAGDAVLLGENDRGEWELLGGRLEPGESVEQAVAREVLEEAGMRVAPGARLLDEVVQVLPGRTVRIVALRCELLDAPTALRPSEEHRRVAFVLRSELAGLRLPDVYRRAIDLAG